jgi:hypothetical protein
MSRAANQTGIPKTTNARPDQASVHPGLVSHHRNIVAAVTTDREVDAALAPTPVKPSA